MILTRYEELWYQKWPPYHFTLITLVSNSIEFFFTKMNKLIAILQLDRYFSSYYTINGCSTKFSITSMILFHSFDLDVFYLNLNSSLKKLRFVDYFLYLLWIFWTQRLQKHIEISIFFPYFEKSITYRCYTTLSRKNKI